MFYFNDQQVNYIFHLHCIDIPNTADLMNFYIFERLQSIECVIFQFNLKQFICNMLGVIRLMASKNIYFVK